METILAVALLVSSILHIIFAIVHHYERKKWETLENTKTSQPLLSLQDAIPTANDARFLRKQFRNPSWKNVYKEINKAIHNGEAKCEIWFLDSRNDPKIPYEELKEELGALGYSVRRFVDVESCDRHFIVTWG